MSTGAAGVDNILVVHEATRRFGGLTAVDVTDLSIERGRITALIGPNGAGKTTLFNVLTGFDRGGEGSWTLDGEQLHGRPAHRVAQAGMVRTFQLTKALRRLTVMENMLLGATGQSGERFLGALTPWRWRSQERANTARAEELLERFNMAHMRDEYAGAMSGGQRKLLEMARALMVEPQLLMLDEPMAGVNPALTQSLLQHVVALRDEGRTVVFVEHDMDVVNTISDRVVVMAQGEIIADGEPAEIGRNQQVIDAYLGTRRRPVG